MSESKIQSALVQAVVNGAFGLPTAYENVDFTPPATAWMAVTNLPASIDPSSNGVGGLDEHVGVFQIDLNYPSNKGTKDIMAKADAVLQYFVAGRRFIYQGQCVQVQRKERTQLRPVGAWVSTSISIYYTSYSTRPEI